MLLIPQLELDTKRKLWESERKMIERQAVEKERDMQRALDDNLEVFGKS